jgi:DNA-binding NtrC family response regulator
MNKSVLIIDDDFVSRLILKKTMQKHDFEIFEAENGEQALEILKNNEHIVLVSLDLNMPVMDGYAFLYEVNKSALKNRLKIFITSCSGRNEFIRTTEMNAIDTVSVAGYFEKPFIMERFADTLLAYTT